MTISPEELIASLQWRYATKEFDTEKKIPAETWDAFEQSMVLTPSSFGLQPWKFLTITDQDIKTYYDGNAAIYKQAEMVRQNNQRHMNHRRAKLRAPQLTHDVFTVLEFMPIGSAQHFPDLSMRELVKERERAQEIGQAIEPGDHKFGP